MGRSPYTQRIEANQETTQIEVRSRKAAPGLAGQFRQRKHIARPPANVSLPRQLLAKSRRMCGVHRLARRGSH